MVKAAERRLAAFQGLTIALLFIGYTGFYLCRSNLSVAGKPIQGEMETWGMTAQEAKILFGDIVTAGTIGYAVGKFLGGTLCDFLGGRRTFLLGMLGAVLATVAFGLGRSVPILFAAWVGNRLVQSIGWPGIIKLVSRWFSFASYGTVMGFISLSYLFGDALARKFLGLLFWAGLSWRTIFLIAAGVLAAIWVLSLILLRESPISVGLKEPEANPASVFGAHAGDARPEDLRTLLGPLLRSPAFWLVCGLSMGMTLLRETFNNWTPTYFGDVLHMSTPEAADASALFSLCGGVSVLAVGFLSDRLGRGGRAAIMLGGLFLTGIALSLLGTGTAAANRTWAVGLVATVGFLLIGPYSFLAGAISLDFGGKQGSASASGLVDGFGYVGGALAGSGVARLSASLGWKGAFLALSGVAWFSALVALAFLIQQIRKPRQIPKSTGQQ